MGEARARDRAHSEAGMTPHPLDGLDEEIRDHIERETQDNIDRGMAPVEARAAALRHFGNVALAMEHTRAVWIPVWLDQLGQDMRYGLRMLRRAPAFSAIVMLTLGVGIGLSTAVFSVVNAVLVRPLSYPHAERLFRVSRDDDRANGGGGGGISPGIAPRPGPTTPVEPLPPVFLPPPPHRNR